MEDKTLIDEFKIEAQEMFENSEAGFLSIEKGEDFTTNYNLIFRAFHSLKGAAGMFGLLALQSHMHKLETLFEDQKNYNKLNKTQIDYFLLGIDCAKSFLEGKNTNFKYYSIEEFKELSPEKQTKNENQTNLAPSQKISSIVREKHKEIESKSKNGLFYIVDDESAVLFMLKELITALGFDVKTFDNAHDLLKEIDNDSPDVLLSDIRMPEMDGIQLLKKLRENDNEIPVIFISGYISKEVMLEALENGAYGFIEKPFNEVHLKSICNNAISKVRIQKLLHKSINYILYQFSDLDLYLKETGKDSHRKSLKQELANILEQQKKLKELSKPIQKTDC